MPPCLKLPAYVLALAASVLALAPAAAADTGYDLAARGKPLHCWSPPPPQTMQETIAVARNAQARGSWSTAVTPVTGGGSALLLSAGAQRTAYAAGLLAGWSETGRRPEFTAVTGADHSAAVAIFAFLGAGRDGKLADLFNCPVEDWTAFAERAAATLDAEDLARIAAKHRSGGRLLVALSGSPVRPETLWDIGVLAGGPPERAMAELRTILRASVDPLRDLDLSRLTPGAGRSIQRNWLHRRVGTGEPVLQPPAALAQHYIIHNGILPYQSEEYVAGRQARAGRAEVEMVTVYDVVEAARGAATQVSIAAMSSDAVRPLSSFDPGYMRALFLRAFREGRTGTAWTQAPGRRDASEASR